MTIALNKCQLQNILLTKEHEGTRIVKIADFGLAKMSTYHGSVCLVMS